MKRTNLTRGKKKQYITEGGRLEGGPAVDDAPVAGDHGLADAVADQHDVLAVLGHHHVLLVDASKHVDHVVPGAAVEVSRRGSHGVPDRGEIPGATLVHRDHGIHLHRRLWPLDRHPPHHLVVGHVKQAPPRRGCRRVLLVLVTVAVAVAVVRVIAATLVRVSRLRRWHPCPGEERQREAVQLGAVGDGRVEAAAVGPRPRRGLQAVEARLLVGQDRRQQRVHVVGLRVQEGVRGLDRGAGGREEVHVEVGHELAVPQRPDGARGEVPVAREVAVDEGREHARARQGLGHREAAVLVEVPLAARREDGPAEGRVSGGVARGRR
uniref:Uncharacterized protein n=1 Tax=Zea mays TaxID=4577 RepID=A0A804QRA2_MAIZE